MFINSPTFMMIELGFGLLMFLGIIGIAVFYIIRNNRKPKLTVSATVVGKRKLSHRKASDRHYFEVESGDRIEFWVTSYELHEWRN